MRSKTGTVVAQQVGHASRRVDGVVRAVGYAGLRDEHLDAAPYVFTDAVFEPQIEERFQLARAALERAKEPVPDA